MATTLGQVAVGSIVTLNENGVPQNYIVVQQGKPSDLYDDSCNGTWLLRQNIYNNVIWNSSSNNTYTTSAVNTLYLPNTILPIYDVSIQASILTVKIPYVNGTGSGGAVASGANGLSTKLFLLSGYEVGWNTTTDQYFPIDGAVLSYFQNAINSDRVAYYNSKVASWWLRSPYTGDTISVWYVSTFGGYGTYSPNSGIGIRPAMVLPTTLTVNDDNSIQPPTVTLGELTPGTIVNINEAGKPVPFYVAQQNYQSSLNGSGRTLMVRKEVYDTRQWNSSNVNAYATSAIDNWLNTTYKSFLDDTIQSNISETTFPYTPGKGNTTVGNLSRSVFLLSGTELGSSISYINVEGSVLPIASILQIAYFNGEISVQWTRSPYISNTYDAIYLNSAGYVSHSYCTDIAGCRPSFTLPSTSIISGNSILIIPTPTITIPSNAMQGQPIPISWTAVDGATNYQLQRNTGSGWSTIYTGPNTSYQDTAGSWTTVQYQVAAEVSGTYGPYGQSTSIPVISASALVISGTDGNLGTVTSDIEYTVTSDTGNSISLVRKVNNIQVASLSVNSGFAYNIPIMDLPTGENSITITASVQSTSGPVTVTRNWTYTKTPIEFPNSAGVATLVQNNKNVLPVTISEAVRTPALWGGSLDKTLEVLSQAALYKTITTPTSLQDIPVGGKFYLTYNGEQVEIIRLVDNYENSGRILVAFTQPILADVWGSDGSAYPDGPMDTWLNTTFLSNLSEGDQVTAVNIQVYTTAVSSSSGVVGTISRAVFPPSYAEYGGDTADGTSIPELLSAVSTRAASRTPYNANYVYAQNTDGSVSGSPSAVAYAKDSIQYCRPMFTLPGDFVAYATTTSGLYDLSDNLLLKLPGVQIETGSYVGTGTYGEDNQNSLTFKFPVNYIFISNIGYKTALAGFSPEQSSFSISGYNTLGAENKISVSNDGKTLKWYSGSSNASAQTQLNVSGTTYYYLAIST